MDERPLLHRIHNPRNYVCGCDPDCWCRRTRIGRLVKWWFPARYFGIRHKNSFFDGMTRRDIRELKREQEEKGLYPMVQPTIVRLGPLRFGPVRVPDRKRPTIQPRYESIVRLGPLRWA